MAREVLTLDAVTEDAANVQVLLDDPTNGIELSEHEYPEPDEDPVIATSVGTEGDPYVTAPRAKNRTITAKIRCYGSATMRTRVKEILEKVGKLKREGGTLKRTLRDSTTIVFDVESARADVPADWMFVQAQSVIVTLEFTCAPYGRGAMQTYSAVTESSLPVAIITAGTIAGDVPALGKLVISDAQGADQWWVAYGVQSRYYDSGTLAKLHYSAEELLPLGGAVTQARSGASGGTTVRQGTLTTTNQAMLSTAYLTGSVHQQHVGDFRVMARLYRPTTNAGTVSVALEWGQGDFRKRTLNDPVVYDVNEREADFTLADLGIVNLTTPAQGAKRWEGRIVAKSSTVGDDVEVDNLMLFPVSEGYGEVSSVLQYENPTTFSARDEFDQTAGALAGKTLPVGGTWAGAGDADDFAVEATGHTVQRTAVSDTGTAGRVVVASTPSLSNTVVQADVMASSLLPAASVPDLGVITRYVDVDNYVAAYVVPISDPASDLIAVQIRKRVAGVNAEIVSLRGSGPSIVASTWYTLRLMVSAAGRVHLWVFRRGTLPGAPLLSGQDSALATGGALASGKVGLYDSLVTSTAITRSYDNFLAFVPTDDAAVFASQSLELRHDRAIREDSTGSYWQPVSSFEGDYLRIPPAGREGRTARIIVKGSRGLPDSMTDPNIDDLTAQLYVTPRFLSVPAP